MRSWPDFGDRGIFEHAGQFRHRGARLHLRPAVQRAVAQRHVARVPRAGRKREADDLGADRWSRRRERAQREAAGAAQLDRERGHGVRAVSQRVVLAHGGRCRRVLVQQRAEAELREERETGAAIRAAVAEALDLEGDGRVGPQAGQLAALPRQIRRWPAAPRGTSSA